MSRLVIALLIALSLSACSKEPAVEAVPQTAAPVAPATDKTANGSPEIRFNSVKERPMTEYKNPKF